MDSTPLSAAWPAMTMHVTAPDDVAAWHLMRALSGGGMPVHRSTTVTGLICALDAVVPVGAELLLDSRTEGARTLVAGAPGVVLRVTSQHEVTMVEVVGEGLALVEETLGQLVSAVKAGLAQPDGWVRMRMWSWRDSYADMSARQVAAPGWDDVVGNYARSTAGQLAPLMTADDLSGRPGRLVLWHGAPGTGKTTAVRALSRQWADWCEPHYVADPELLFAQPSYLLEVAGVDQVDEEKKDAPWRLIVAEDCDEYLRADARQRSGASLGRLLNLCDGILGHGLRVVVLLTTNEDLGSLHPAITRPGRCLNRVEFLPMSMVEARAWLGDDAVAPPHPVTLAELYALREDRTGGGDLDLPELGGYL